LKLPTRLFILFQILDLALTFFAIRWGLAYEVNPVGFTPLLVLLKGVSTLGISYLIEKINFGWLSWILIVIMGVTVSWNTTVIVTELL